jgi:hypothetical protein
MKIRCPRCDTCGFEEDENYKHSTCSLCLGMGSIDIDKEREMWAFRYDNMKNTIKEHEETITKLRSKIRELKNG